jgi:RimJ/RimL family protein N-acetyltransferase
MKASARLYFRDLSTKDAMALFEIYSDAEAMKFRANPPLLNTEDALKMIEQAQKDQLEFMSKRWAVVRKDRDQLIGTLVFHYHKQNSTCTIGYSIGKKSWNKGYGKELLEAMIQAVKDTNYPLIKAFVHSENLASIRMLEKQQFSQTEVNLSEKLLTYSLNLRL